MSKKVLSAKSIAVISFVISVLGFVSETHFFFVSEVLGYLLRFFNVIDLDWLNSRRNGFFGEGFFNYIFYGLLFLGAIFFVISKGRETRLVRFVFATVFFGYLIFTPSSFINIFLLHGYRSTLLSHLDMALIFVLHLGWLWLSWQVLVFFSSEKTLDIQTHIYGQHTSESFIAAAKWQRFANIVIDSVLAMLIYSVLFKAIIYADFENNFLLRMQRVTGEYPALLIIVFICRTFYYVFFETVFSATPAKFLTETRVINNKGEKASIRAVFIRTLSRFIPFEAFSFIFGFTGWHDRISETTVIKEKRTGVKGGWYIATIPAVLLLYWAAIDLLFRISH